MDELNARTPLATASVSAQPDGSLHIALSGELDIASVPVIEEQVQSALSTDPQRLVLDLSDLSFADSSGIGLWVRWSLTFGSFELRNPPPLVAQTLKVMGLDEQLGVTG